MQVPDRDQRHHVAPAGVSGLELNIRVLFAGCAPWKGDSQREPIPSATSLATHKADFRRQAVGHIAHLEVIEDVRSGSLSSGRTARKATISLHGNSGPLVKILRFSHPLNMVSSAPSKTVAFELHIYGDGELLMRRAQSVVIGFGNPMRGDDAVGLEVVRRLREIVGQEIRIREIESDATRLLSAWEDADMAIVVDAMVSGLSAGSIRLLEAWDLLDASDNPFPCPHGVGLLEAVRLAAALRVLPPRLVIVGIEAARFGIGEEMSPEVRTAVDPAAERILGEFCPASQPPYASGARHAASPAGQTNHHA